MDAGQNSSPGRIYFGGCQLQTGSNPQYPQDNTPIKSRQKWRVLGRSGAVLLGLALKPDNELRPDRDRQRRDLAAVPLPHRSEDQPQ